MIEDDRRSFGESTRVQSNAFTFYVLIFQARREEVSLERDIPRDSRYLTVRRALLMRPPLP